MNHSQKGQIPLPMLLLGALALVAVIAVLLAGPSEEPEPTPSLETPAAQEQEGPREVIDVGQAPGRTEDRTPQNDREFTASSGDGRPLGAAIVGSVIDTQGQPVPNATVHLTENLLVQNPFASQTTQGARFSANSSVDGRYRFPRLPGRRRVLDVGHPRTARAARRLSGARAR